MKGVRLYQPGKAVVGSFPEPHITREDEVKIRVQYCSINADDYAVYTGQIRGGYENHEILNEFCGTITALGEVSRRFGFAEGDLVSGTFFSPCGMCPMCRKGKLDLCLELKSHAALNEYIVLDNRAVVRLPSQINAQQGTLFWLAARCMQGGERLDVQPGDTVLIHGGGNAGLMMLQLVRRRMPRLVVVSEPISEKRELALRLGADVVLDPNEEVLAARTLELTDGFGFDRIVDAAGAVRIMPDTVNLLSRGGRLLLFSNYRPGAQLTLDLAELYWKDYSIVSSYNPTFAPYTAHTDFMLGLDLQPLIGQIYPIEQINEAFRAYGTHRYQKILLKL